MRGARIVTAVVFALLLASFITVARPSVQGAQVSVAIQDYNFTPATLTVPVGTTVLWTNQGQDTHTTTSDSGAWDSGTMTKGVKFSFTFTKAGTFAYHCTFHAAEMRATVVVTAAATPTATATHPPPTNTIVPPTPTSPPSPTATPTTAAANATAIRPTPTPIPTPTAPATGTAGAASVIATATPIATATAATAAPTDTPPAAAPQSAALPVQPGPVSLLPFANFVEPIRAFTDLPDHRFFATTDHSLNFGFKSYWEQNGGVAQFGYPISEEFLERGADGAVRTVQYFERARFEYHYDLGTVPFAVQLGMLGRETTSSRMSEPAFLPVGPVGANATPDGPNSSPRRGTRSPAHSRPSGRWAAACPPLATRSASPSGRAARTASPIWSSTSSAIASNSTRRRAASR
ncbi:MAG: cupredoxin domain-containing protein [Thermomicrobiales bacterium]